MKQFTEETNWNKAKRRRERDKERRHENLISANDKGWTKHNEYHWSMEINKVRLHYWPSTKKFQYKDKVMVGNVKAFIKQLQEEK